jgi:hypothetical protein
VPVDVTCNSDSNVPDYTFCGHWNCRIFAEKFVHIRFGGLCITLHRAVRYICNAASKLQYNKQRCIRQRVDESSTFFMTPWLERALHRRKQYVSYFQACVQYFPTVPHFGKYCNIRYITRMYWHTRRTRQMRITRQFCAQFTQLRTLTRRRYVYYV